MQNTENTRQKKKTRGKKENMLRSATFVYLLPSVLKMAICLKFICGCVISNFCVFLYY